MGIPRPDLTIKNIKRYRTIARVFIKYGFGEIVDRMNLTRALKFGRKIFRRKPKEEISAAARVRFALEELGPTFVKLGQVLSMRPFLIPFDLVVELTKLHDQVAPMSWDIALDAIEKNLGCPIDRAFLSIDPEPIASASLSQVHTARLLDNTEVVIKIQRPGIKSVIDSDMIILKDIALLLEKHIPESRQYEPVGLIDELARSTIKEINFLYEARNIEISARNFEDDPDIFVPDVFWDFTTKQMIVMDRIDGIKITDFEKMLELSIDRKDICEKGGKIVFTMIFEHGFFHADPHPGNLLVTKDGRLAPVDYGMMGVLSSTHLNELGDILTSVVADDAASVVHAFSRADVLSDDTNHQALEADVSELLIRYHRVPLARIDMATLFDEFFEIIHRHGVRMKSEFMVFGKALVTYEEVARQLDPEYDLIKSAAPFVKKLAIRRMGLSQILKDARIGLAEFREFIVKFPSDLRSFTSKLNKGNASVNLELKGLEKLIMELDRSTNRLAFALVIAAIIVGSSLVLSLDIGVKIYGLPLLGLSGYLFAGILGAGLVISILRSGKL
ncbi:MAG: AarF/ABC1/UbiB kinase family protein [candidate division Zixibacteria bacterium]